MVLRACNTHEGIELHPERSLFDSDFKEDVALLSPLQEDMQKNTDKLEEKAIPTGLRINVSKTSHIQ